MLSLVVREGILEKYMFATATKGIVVIIVHFNFKANQNYL